MRDYLSAKRMVGGVQMGRGAGAKRVHERTHTKTHIHDGECIGTQTLTQILARVCFHTQKNLRMGKLCGWAPPSGIPKCSYEAKLQLIYARQCEL